MLELTHFIKTNVLDFPLSAARVCSEREWFHGSTWVTLHENMQTKYIERAPQVIIRSVDWEDTECACVCVIGEHVSMSAGDLQLNHESNMLKLCLHEDTLYGHGSSWRAVRRQTRPQTVSEPLQIVQWLHSRCWSIVRNRCGKGREWEEKPGQTEKTIRTCKLERFFGDRKSSRDQKTHNLKLPLGISFERFSCPSRQESTGQIMLKLNNSRIFMHVRQTERHKNRC